jgi:two-component system, NtrC family, sensor kinase
MRLWQQLALAMVAVSLAPLTVVSWQAVELTSSQADAARKAALEREAIAVADELGRWVRLKAQAIAGWANLYPDLTVRPPAVREGLLKAVYRAVPGAVTVALLDEDGLSGPPGAEIAPVWLDLSLPEGDPLSRRPRGSEARAQAFLQRVPRPAEPGQLLVGRPFTPPGTVVGRQPDPALPVAARGPFGDPAVLAVELALDEVDALLGHRASAERAFALVTTDGTRVVSHGEAPDGELLRPLLSQDAATLELPEMGRVGAVAAVPGVPWAVVMTEPAAADTAWRNLRNRLLLALAVSLAVAIFAGILVARSWSLPVAGLRSAALTVAEGDLAHRVPAGRRDELGELAQAFNHMAGRLAATLEELQARRAEVEAFAAELQDRVEARTAELEAAQRDLVRAGQLAAVAEVGAGLAHELNNPLTSVLGSLQVLALRLPEDLRPLAAQAEAEAWRCREVADAMLQVARQDAGDASARRIPLDEVVREAARLGEAVFRRRGVALEVATDAPDLHIEADPAAAVRILTQVLQGLGAGLPEGASLSVRTRASERSGHGPVAVVELVPDRPVATGSSRDHYLAAGLGLWVARRLLTGRGGRLVEPDDRDGEGAWRLELPAA